VSIAERVFEAFKFLTRLGDRVDDLSAEVKRLALEHKDLELRVAQLETAMEMASGGSFRAATRKMLPPTERS
jgi:hypothetical protein